MPPCWINDFEVIAIIRVPVSTLFAYYSNLIVDGVASDAPLTCEFIIRDVAKFELTNAVIMTFLSVALDGEHLGVPAHERRRVFGILLALPSAVLTILA